MAATALAATACGTELPGSVLHKLQAGASASPGTVGTGSGAGIATAEPASQTAAATPSPGSPLTGTGPGGTETGAPGPAGQASASQAGVSPSECSAWGTGAPGVTPGEIQVATFDTDSGPLPGATAGAYRATASYFAMVNAAGGVCGHKLVTQEADDGLDPSQGRSQFEKLAPHVLAFVGNFGAADSGYADLIESSGVPYVGLSVDPDTKLRMSSEMFPKVNPALVSDAPYVWLHQQHPQAIKAAVIYLDIAGVTGNIPPTEAAMKRSGFDIVYTAGLSPTAPDYTPQVLGMRSAGVQMIMAYALEVNMQARLERDMAQQGFKPALEAANVAYDGDYARLLGSEGVGWENPLTYAPFLEPDESSAYPGMATFTQWTAQTFPGQKDDLFAVDGWEHAAYFVQALRLVHGPLTRQSLVAALNSIHQISGDGVVAPVDPTTGNPTNCFDVPVYDASGWQLVYPSAGGYACKVGEVIRWQ